MSYLKILESYKSGKITDQTLERIIIKVNGGVNSRTDDGKNDIVRKNIVRSGRNDIVRISNDKKPEINSTPKPEFVKLDPKIVANMSPLVKSKYLQKYIQYRKNGGESIISGKSQSRNNVNLRAKKKKVKKPPRQLTEKEKERIRKREEEKKRQIELIKKKQATLNKYTEIMKDQASIIKHQKEFTSKLSKIKMESRIRVLNNFTVIKEFATEHHYSHKVELLEGFIVKKYVEQTSFGHFLFKNEVNSLKKLIPFKHCPTLVAYDSARLIIYMTYCGETISSKNIPSNWQEQYNNISKILKTTGVNSNDMLMRNTCVLNNKIYIIDFGLDTVFGENIDIILKKFYKRLATLGSNSYQKQKMKSNYNAKQVDRMIQ